MEKFLATVWLPSRQNGRKSSRVREAAPREKARNPCTFQLKCTGIFGDRLRHWRNVAGRLAVLDAGLRNHIVTGTDPIVTIHYERVEGANAAAAVHCGILR